MRKSKTLRPGPRFLSFFFFFFANQLRGFRNRKREGSHAFSANTAARANNAKRATNEEHDPLSPSLFITAGQTCRYELKKAKQRERAAADASSARTSVTG